MKLNHQIMERVPEDERMITTLDNRIFSMHTKAYNNVLAKEARKMSLYGNLG